MKKLIVASFVILGISSCKKTEIQEKIADGVYTQTSCELGIDTFEINSDQFRITRYVRANNTFFEEIKGQLIYDGDSLFLIPSNQYYTFKGGRWVETLESIAFNFSNSLVLETQKPLMYISENGSDTSGCNILNFSKL